MRLFIGLSLLVIFSLTAVRADTFETQANGQKAPVNFLPAQGEGQHGGILIVGSGAPWDHSELLPKLGGHFAKLGWSVALLDASQQIDKPTWVESLPEILSTLRQKNNKRTILLYYGSQMHFLLEYFSKPQSKQVNGLILLSAFDQFEAKDSVLLLQKLPFPVLDVVAQFDYGTILEQAAVRKKNNQSKSYRQVRFPGAVHDYYHTRRMLSYHLHSWMLNLQPTEIAGPPVVLD